MPIFTSSNFTQPDINFPFSNRRNLPAGFAVFAHLLERYATAKQPASLADKAIKTALDQFPNSQEIVERFMANWLGHNAEERQAVFGDIFGDYAIGENLAETEIQNQLAEIVLLEEKTPSGIILRKDMQTNPPAELRMPAHNTAIDSAYRQDGESSANYQLDFAGLYRQEEASRNPSERAHEPYVIFSMTDGIRTWATRTHIYDNMNGNDIQPTDASLLSLYSNTQAGNNRDLAIISTVMEHGFGNPDHFRDEIHILVEAGRAVAAAYQYPVPEFVAALTTDAVDWLVDADDDKIATQAIVIPADNFNSLAQTAPVNVKGLDYNLLAPIHSGENAKYWVTYYFREAMD